MTGDYPLIRGDQCIFFMYNDDREHTESQGERLLAEIHGMAYAFDAPDGSALWNTGFVHYDLINRSDHLYHDVYSALFSEFEIGYPWDDYVGSDVMRRSFYGFNGDDFDEDWSYTGSDIDLQTVYHEYPPAQSVTILGGPFLDADGEDDPSGGCDFSINGFRAHNIITCLFDKYSGT